MMMMMMMMMMRMMISPIVSPKVPVGQHHPATAQAPPSACTG